MKGKQANNGLMGLQMEKDQGLGCAKANATVWESQTECYALTVFPVNKNLCVLRFPSIEYSCNTLSKGENSINTVNPIYK